MDSLDYLISMEEGQKRKIEERFSFKWLAQCIIKRQKQDKDTIMIVTGERRNGKSNWALKLVQQYISQRKKEAPDFKWNWNDNFPKTRQEALDNIESIPDNSFVVYDEAGDIMYSADTLNALNKKLVKFMAKSGKKGLLTIIVLPDIFMLDKKILNMALFLIAVPYRYKKVCSFAFMYGRNPNPLTQDKFGLQRIKRMFESKKGVPLTSRMPTMTGKMSVVIDNKMEEIPYPKSLFTFLRSLPTFIHWHRFGKVSQRFEDAYKKNVKDKQLSMQDEFNFISYAEYNVIRTRYDTLLYNLNRKQELSYAQLERLHRNFRGIRLMNATTIRKRIEDYEAKYGATQENVQDERPQKEIPEIQAETPKV